MNRKFSKKLISFITIFTLCFNSIAFAAKPPENKKSEVNNKNPKTDLKVAVRKNLDMVVITDYQGQKFDNLNSKLNELKGNLYNKNVDVQYNMIDENTKIVSDLYDNTYENTALYNTYPSAKLTHDRKVQVFWPTGYSELNGAYPNTYIDYSYRTIDGYSILDDTPAGTIKTAGFWTCVVALTHDGKLYYTGTLKFCGQGNVITVPYTGFHLAMTDVKDIIPGCRSLFVLKNDGTIYYTGSLGRYTNIINDCVADPFAPESIFTNGLQKIEGLKNITRIFASSLPSSDEGGDYTVPTIIAINDTTGDVYGVGWNKGQFGYHTPQYWPSVAGWLNRYLNYYIYPIEIKPVKINKIDGRNVKDWQIVRNERSEYSLIYMKDGSYYKLKGNGFHLIYSGGTYWTNRSVNPYGTYEVTDGNTYCKVGNIYPGSLSKITTLPKNVLKIRYRREYGNIYYDLYCNDLKKYVLNFNDSISDTQIAETLSSGNYGEGISFAPETYRPYPIPAPLINPIYSLNTDSIMNLPFRNNSDKILLYISDNADTTGIYSGEIELKTNLADSIYKMENFDDIHTANITYSNCTIINDPIINSSNCLYAKQTDSNNKGVLDISINVPFSAVEARLSFRTLNKDCILKHNGSNIDIKSQYEFTYKNIKLTPGIYNNIHIETCYKNETRPRPRPGDDYDYGDYEPAMQGEFYIDDIEISYNTSYNYAKGFGCYYPLLELSNNVAKYLMDNNIKCYAATPSMALDFIENKYGHQDLTLRQLISNADGKVYGVSQYNDALKDIENLYTNSEATNIKVILGETVDYNKVFNDIEIDPEIKERWKYEHDPNIYENNLGVAYFNNNWLSNPIIDLPYVGRYVVTYQGKDAPTNLKVFDEYNLWSTDEKQAIIDVHRRPIAEFFYTQPSSGTWNRSVNEKDNFDDERHFNCTASNTTIKAGGYEGNASYGKSLSDSSLSSITATLVVPKGVTDALFKFKAKGNQSGYTLKNEYDDVISSAKFYNSSTYNDYSIPLDEGKYILNIYATYSASSGTKPPKPRPGDDFDYGDYEPEIQGDFYVDDLSFTYTKLVPYKALSFIDASFDYDHESLPNKGIVAWEWKYKEINDTAWTTGLPTYINKDQTLLVYLRVQDMEGAWSYPCIKIIYGMAPDINISPLQASWTNKNVNVSITSKDNSDTGLDVMGYTISNYRIYPKVWTDILLNGAPTNTTNVVLQNEGKWYLHAYASSSNGAQAYKYAGLYLIDKTPPIININSESGLIPKDFLLILDTIDALSGVTDVWYNWSNSKGEINNFDSFCRLPYTMVNNITAPTVDGIYYLHIKCRDKATNLSYKIYGPYKVENLTVAASVAPNPAKQGQKVIFKADTTGYPKHIVLYFPLKMSTVPISVQIPEKANHTEYIPYYVPIKTPMTIDRDGNRLTPQYEIIVKAIKADGTFKTTTVNLDVKGSILDGIKTEILNN